MNRKLWSNEEKVAIVPEILRGDEALVRSMSLSFGRALISTKCK